MKIKVISAKLNRACMIFIILISNECVILNTNKIQEKICAEILYKPVKNSYEIVGLIFSKF